MIVRADQCTFKFLDEPKSLIISRPPRDNRIRWHCRLKDMDSPGTPGHESFAKPVGLDYQLFDATGACAGTLKNFSLERVNPQANYKVVTSKRTLTCSVTHVEFGGKTLFPEHQLGMVVPPGSNLGVAGGSISGIGGSGPTKGTRIPLK
jgi:hypothetical protein